MNRLVLLLVCVVLPGGWPLIGWTVLAVRDRIRRARHRRRMKQVFINAATATLRDAARAERRRP